MAGDASKKHDGKGGSMGNSLLLVGSVPLDTVEEVMRTFGGALAPYLPALPDGEVGERRSWVNRLGYQIFNGHLDLETIRRPKPVDGVEQLLPRGRDDSWQFKVQAGCRAGAIRQSRLASRLRAGCDQLVFRVPHPARERHAARRRAVPDLHSDGQQRHPAAVFSRSRRSAAHPAGLRGGAGRRSRRDRRQDSASGLGDPVGLRLGIAGGLRRRQRRTVRSSKSERMCRDRAAIAI